MFDRESSPAVRSALGVTIPASAETRVPDERHHQGTCLSPSAQLFTQPRARQTPVEPSRGHRNPEHFGDLLVGQAAKEPHLDHAGLTLAQLRQPVEGRVQRDQLVSAPISSSLNVIGACPLPRLNARRLVA